MISDDEINEINFALAIGYIIKTIQIQGMEQIMGEVDNAFEIPEYRLYVRSLVKKAVEIMKSENIDV